MSLWCLTQTQGLSTEFLQKPDEAGRPHAADAKRRKTGGPAGSEDTRQESDPPRSKCDAFWYKDGNVVVVVGNTAFKLYKARLSRYSIVLAGQFADEGAGRPTMEGCPVYELAGLKVEDFKQFLEALETPMYVFPLMSESASRPNRLPDSPACLPRDPRRNRH